MGRFGRNALVILAAVGAAAYFLQENLPWTYWDSRASPIAPSDRYHTAAVTRGDVRQTVTATGTLNPIVAVEVGTQVSGQLAKVLADFNDHVKKGQPLAELDRRSFDAKVAEARAATTAAETLVAVQKSKLDRARVDVRDAHGRTAVLQARVEVAAVRRQAAETTLSRAVALSARGVSSSIQLEQAQTERDIAAALLREAEALAGANSNAIAGAEADVQRAAAELANAVAGVPQKKAHQLAAEIELERTIIRSPIDGIVVGRSFSEGQTVASSLEAPTLFMIAGDLERMDIHTRVDESDIGRIKVGQQATFTVDAHPGRQFDAEVVAVRQAPQQQSGSGFLRRAQSGSSNVVTYTVILRTSNPSMLLLPGMTAAVRVIIEETKDALIVPMAAFRFKPQPQDQTEQVPPREPNMEMVWVWDGRAVRSVPFEVGAMDGVRAAARSAPRLNEGDQVIVTQAPEAAPKRSAFGIKFGL